MQRTQKPGHVRTFWIKRLNVNHWGGTGISSAFWGGDVENKLLVLDIPCFGYGWIVTEKATTNFVWHTVERTDEIHAP